MKLLCVICGIFILCGCATSVDVGKATPTHYWKPTVSEVSQREYDHDNSNCESTSGVTGSEGIAVNAPSFEAYQQCMIEEGYSLQIF